MQLYHDNKAVGRVVCIQSNERVTPDVKDNASSCHAYGWAKTGLNKSASLFQLLPFHPTQWDIVSLDFIIDLCAVKKSNMTFLVLMNLFIKIS